MNNNTEMPTITFAPDATYDTLFCVLRHIDWAVDVYLSDGSTFLGTYDDSKGDEVTFFLFDELAGVVTGPYEKKTVHADRIVRIDIA